MRAGTPLRPAAKPVRTTLGRRPNPYLLGMLAEAQRWKSGPRRRAILLGGLALVVVALLLLGLLPGSSRLLVSIAVPLLVVLVLLGTAITTYTVLLLARQVHVQNGRLERILLRNREVVHERATALARRLDAVEAAQSRLPFLEQYVEAVAEGSAASNTRLRDLLESLDLEQAVERSRPTQ